MCKFFKNRRGDGYIGVVVSVLVIMMVTVVSLNVFSFLTIKQDMDYFTKQTLDLATVNGCAAIEESRYNELSEETGLAPSVTWQADYYNTAAKTVQYGDTIKVTLTYQTYIRGFGVFKIPVTLTSSYSGLSQKYFK
jgi:hypothetical protein